MMNNTIILLRGKDGLSKSEYAKFSKGDTIFGTDSEPVEIMRWDIAEHDLAEQELAKYECLYDDSNPDYVVIEEYALAYCECDDDGDFIQGSDFRLAKEGDTV